jgi:Ca2+/Na+ antiporter
MIYYKFFFYYIYKGYLEKGEKNLAGLFTLHFMSLIFFLNFLSFFIIFFLLILKGDREVVTGLSAVIFYIFILAFNYFYFYLKRGKEQALILFSTNNLTNTKKIKQIIWTYIIVSMLLIVSSLYFYFHPFHKT